MASNQKNPKNITSKSKADNEKLLTCYICHESENKNFRKTHCTNKEHSMREQFFKKNFVNISGGRVHCKLCKINISNYLFIKHARNHKLMPWYKPEDEHELLFENFISPVKSNDQFKYYCHLCDLVTNHWFELLTHIDEIFHQELLSNFKKNIFVKEISPTLRKELTVNGIFAFHSKLLQCWLCQCIIGGYRDSKAHIANETHQSNFVKLHEIILGKTKLVPIVTVTNNDSTSEPFPKYFDNFIAKRADDNYYCNLCENEYLSLTLILEHIDDPVHINLWIHERRSRGIVADTSFSFDFCQVLVENNIFKFDFSHLKCYSCKNIIFLDDSVDDHIKRHKNNIRCGSLAVASDPINLNGDNNDDKNHLFVLSESKNDFFTYFENFIEKRDKVYVCHVCNINLPSLFTVINHTINRDHQNLVRNIKKCKNFQMPIRKINKIIIFVTNGIFQFSDTKLKCHTCQVIFGSSKAAKEHVLDPQHQIERQKLTGCQLSAEQEYEKTVSVTKHYKDIPSKLGTLNSSTKQDNEDNEEATTDEIFYRVPLMQDNHELLPEQINKKTTAKIQKYPEYICSMYIDDDEKILTCFICSITQLWKKHITDQEHLCRQKFFFHNFSDSPGDKVVCKVCKNDVPKSSVIDHAADEHQLMPWYRPADEFVTCFKNYIFPMGYKYYCHLCDKVFYRWYLGLEHIKSIKHCENVKERIKDQDIDNEALSPDFCEKLSTNNIFPLSFEQLRCWACDFVIDGYENADKHITSRGHVNFLRQKKTQLLGWKYKNSENDFEKKLPPGNASVRHNKSDIRSNTRCIGGQL
ncbi:uncharacterized protein LOC130670282 [Microplitis mediator]|uniref:uncharacterized protein LOC130670282 n=1 Tax=Microplitis mediator TaxID=375433 RepID=UPI002553A5D3|nr:uncharacterized protein LOC130670282 [Microplitis mediator]